MKNKSLQECLNYIQVNLKAPKNMQQALIMIIYIIVIIGVIKIKI